jgi:hypothetical protein
MRAERRGYELDSVRMTYVCVRKNAVMRWMLSEHPGALCACSPDTNSACEDWWWMCLDACVCIWMTYDS